MGAQLVLTAHPGGTSASGGGVKRGDVQDLLVKVFGLAARNPMEYCRTIKEKTKVLPPAIETFDLVAHQPVGAR
jgi:hypothetical protein